MDEERTLRHRVTVLLNAPRVRRQGDRRARVGPASPVEQRLDLGEERVLPAADDQPAGSVEERRRRHDLQTDPRPRRTASRATATHPRASRTDPRYSSCSPRTRSTSRAPAEATASAVESGSATTSRPRPSIAESGGANILRTTSRARRRRRRAMPSSEPSRTPATSSAARSAACLGKWWGRRGPGRCRRSARGVAAAPRARRASRERLREGDAGNCQDDDRRHADDGRQPPTAHRRARPTPSGRRAPRSIAGVVGSGRWFGHRMSAREQDPRGRRPRRPRETGRSRTSGVASCAGARRTPSTHRGPRRRRTGSTASARAMRRAPGRFAATLSQAYAPAVTRLIATSHPRSRAGHHRAVFRAAGRRRAGLRGQRGADERRDVGPRPRARHASASSSASRTGSIGSASAATPTPTADAPAASRSSTSSTVADPTDPDHRDVHALGDLVDHAQRHRPERGPADARRSRRRARGRAVRSERETRKCVDRADRVRAGLLDRPRHRTDVPGGGRELGDHRQVRRAPGGRRPVRSAAPASSPKTRAPPPDERLSSIPATPGTPSRSRAPPRCRPRRPHRG